MTRGRPTFAKTRGRGRIRLLVALGLAGCVPAVPTPSGGDGAGTTSAAGLTTSGLGGATSGWSGTSGGTSSGAPNTNTGATDLTDSTGGSSSTGYGTGNLCGEYPIGISFCCDAIAQNCGAGDKCTWWANDGGSIWNATQCRPIPPDPAPLGATCTVSGYFFSGIDTCEAGTMCFWMDIETREGTCVAYCDPYAPESTCPKGTRCHGWEPEDLALCLPDCEPLTAECSHSSCVPTDQGFACLSRYNDKIDPMNFCEFTNGCEPGLSCLDAEDVPPCEWEKCCAAYCDLTDRISSCSEGTTCRPYFGDGPVQPGHENLGYCGLEP